MGTAQLNQERHSLRTALHFEKNLVTRGNHETLIECPLAGKITFSNWAQARIEIIDKVLADRRRYGNA